MKQSTPALDAYIMAALYPNEQSAKNAFELMEGSGKTDIDQEIVTWICRKECNYLMPNLRSCLPYWD